MSKILFVVHRYAPFPGGSEYYVRDMAEEMQLRGHDVTVLAHEHQGDLNRVKVTNDYNILVTQKWKLIIVHGCDCVSQNIVLSNAAVIKSPILYMIIKPSMSPVALHGMKYAKYVAYSTSMDLEHIKNNGGIAINKARRVRHGIVVPTSLGHGWGQNPDIKTYVSAGGFYPHKAMVELNDAFMKYKLRPTDSLFLFGYADGPKPIITQYVGVFLGETRQKMLDYMASSDGYIMNSYEEGFGLVLLEAMLNKVPCYARNIAGAKDMKPYVMTYENEQELFQVMAEYEGLTNVTKLDILDRNYEYVMANHSIRQTCNDLDDILTEERE